MIIKEVKAKEIYQPEITKKIMKFRSQEEKIRIFQNDNLKEDHAIDLSLGI